MKPKYWSDYSWESLKVIVKQILALAFERLLYPDILYLSGAEGIAAKHQKDSMRIFESFYLFMFSKNFILKMYL